MVEAREATMTDNGKVIMDKQTNRYKLAKEYKEQTRKSPTEKVEQARTSKIALIVAIPARHCSVPMGMGSKHDLFRQTQSNGLFLRL